MNVSQIHRSSQVIEPIAVSVSGITFDDSRNDVIDFAITAAGESRGSIFGVDVTNVENDTATVYLHRD